MRWHISHRCDAAVRPLADRHYNRQSIGADNFVPPGRCLVLRTEPVRAFWVTSWPFAEYTKHRWGGRLDLLGIPTRGQFARAMASACMGTHPRSGSSYPSQLARRAGARHGDVRGH